MVPGGTSTGDVRHDTAILQRALLSVRGEPCPYGCSYCFERFAEYAPNLQLAEVLARPELVEDVQVLYPACDTDFFLLRGWERTLESVVALGRHVSLSTKAPISERTAGRVARVIAGFGRPRQIVKVAVSFAAAGSATWLEPRTPPPRVRLASMRHLSEAGVMTALVLKPIVADVPACEYRELLVASRPWTDRVLVGDEWVSPAQPRQEPTSDRAMERSLRPGWTAVRAPLRKRTALSQRTAVLEYSAELGFRAFESDLDLMADVIRGH